MGGARDSIWYSTPRSARKRKGVEITMCDEMREKLDELCRALDIPRGAVVEMLIQKYLEREIK